MITLHHLENSRSLRIVWLLEELGLDYEIRHYTRDSKTMLAPPELKQVRQSSQVPVLFLTARQDEVDRILGLELGGDDYVTKPFSPREVVARIRAILKRLAPRADDSTASLWQLDEAGARILFRGTELALTRSEFRILSALLKHPGQVFTRAQLLDICDSDEDSFERSVDTHIKTLRAKLRPLDGENLVATRRGIGYYIESDAE